MGRSQSMFQLQAVFCPLPMMPLVPFTKTPTMSSKKFFGSEQMDRMGR